MKYTVEINKLDDFHPWSGGEATVKAAYAQGKGDELFALIEETFGDSVPTETEINDFLWFDAPDLIDLYGESSTEEEADDSEADETPAEEPEATAEESTEDSVDTPAFEEENTPSEEPSDDISSYDDIPEDMKVSDEPEEPLTESVVRGDDLEDEEKPFYGVVGIKDDGTAVAIGVFTSVDDATDAGSKFTDETEGAVDFDIFGADTEQECDDEFTFRLFKDKAE